MKITDTTPLAGDATTGCAALEAVNSSWILAVGDPSDASRTGLHRLSPHDVDGLLAKLGQARQRAPAPGGARVVLTHEAGYEGFWLARRLEGEDLEVVVVDPASLEVVRRRKKGRTDRIDARRMVRALRAWDGGDRDAMSPVRVPTVAEEDAKRLLRRRERLVKEKRRLANSVGGLLRLHGAPPGDAARAGFRDRLEGLRTGYGTELPPGLLAEILGILDRLDLVRAELRAVEAEKAAALKASQEALAALPAKAAEAEPETPPSAPAAAPAADPEAERACRAASRSAPGSLPGGDGTAETGPPPAAAPEPEPDCSHQAAALARLRGIGPNDALLLVAELSCRSFRNRRQLASMAGLAPVPWASGGVDHDQGISKAGSPMMGKHLVQMAWRWLRHQPDSALAKWFREYVSARDGRSRKRGIVALARKLLVALWRYATTGLVPEGAVLSPA